MKKTFIFFGTFLCIALLIVAFNAWRSGYINKSLLERFNRSHANLIEPNTLRDGEVVCLPLKSGKEPGLCVFGLLTESGEYYRMIDMGQVGPEGTIKIGDRLRVIGDLYTPRKTNTYKSIADISTERIENLPEKKTQ